jgi:hypothetical protein
MSNFNAIEDFPETYIYNNYHIDQNSKGEENEIDIDRVVFELLQCGRNKEKFDLIMENLERDYLGEDKLSDVDEEENYHHQNIKSNTNHFSNTYNNNPNTSFNRKNSEFSTLSFLQSARSGDKFAHPEMNNTNFKEQKYQMSTSPLRVAPNNFQSSMRSNHGNIPKQNETNNFGKKQVIHHKKYTDVHANTKYYYPDDYYNNPYEN